MRPLVRTNISPCVTLISLIAPHFFPTSLHARSGSLLIINNHTIRLRPEVPSTPAIRAKAQEVKS